jgi:hypothetical protein
MKKTLHQGSEIFEILGKHDSVMKFRDVPSAVAFLRRFRNEPMQMVELRATIAAHSTDAHRLNEEQVLTRFASLLVSGKSVMIRSVAHGRSAHAEEELEAEKSGAEKAPPPAAKSWIEINLKDESGNCVAHERYRIKFPDGSVQEGQLDDFGHYENYQINKGTCEVSFPDLEDEEWAKV